MPMNMEASVDTKKNKEKDPNKPFSYAPGGGKCPENIMTQKDMEVKAFPKHFPTGKYGKDYPRNHKITNQMYFTQRILNKDERFAMDPFYVFMACAFVERQALENQINISGFKGIKSKNENGVWCIHLTDVFDVLKKVKGTPKYWQSKRNDLVAKVKQLGPFHIFFTFSCGEMRWSEIYISVFKRKNIDVHVPDNWSGDDDELLVDGIPLWTYVNQMDQSKYELFKDYTLLITRMFDKRVEKFIKEILMGSGKGKVPISYYSYRVEFQARGKCIFSIC